MSWQVGDYVPLNLFIPNGDGSTTVTATYSYTGGGGGTVTPAPVTSDGGMTWTASVQVTSVGTWTVEWSIAGSGAGVEPFTFYVDNLPPVPWAPSLRDVADLIPARTVPLDTATDNPHNTFDTNTVPSGEQVARIIQTAVRWVVGKTGTMPVEVYGQAGDVAALRAAGLVELGYPVREGDVSIADTLLRQADSALVELVATVSAQGDADPSLTLMPVGYFPQPNVTEEIPAYKTWWPGGQNPPQPGSP